MATTSKKMMITDVFVNGAFQGWNIATHSTIPNVLMAFVIIKMLNISGALDFIGTCLGPVMAIFGLPGEAAMILLGGWMSWAAVSVWQLPCSIKALLTVHSSLS